MSGWLSADRPCDSLKFHISEIVRLSIFFLLLDNFNHGYSATSLRVPDNHNIEQSTRVFNNQINNSGSTQENVRMPRDSAGAPRNT